jgi:L-asparaginase
MKDLLTSSLTLATLLFVWTASAAGQTAPHVHMVATGGTISNREGGRLSAEDLAKSIPGLERHANLTYEQFANVASSQLTLDQWIRLARRVNELFADDSSLAGIVVTSGTDTLEETAGGRRRDANAEHAGLRRRR